MKHQDPRVSAVCITRIEKRVAGRAAVAPFLVACLFAHTLTVLPTVGVAPDRGGRVPIAARKTARAILATRRLADRGHLWALRLEPLARFARAVAQQAALAF